MRLTRCCRRSGYIYSSLLAQALLDLKSEVQRKVGKMIDNGQAVYWGGMSARTEVLSKNELEAMKEMWLSAAHEAWL